MQLDNVAIAAIAGAVVAACQMVGTLSTNRRLRTLHDCLDEHRAESRSLLVTAMKTDDARDLRNAKQTGTKPILSGVEPIASDPNQPD